MAGNKYDYLIKVILVGDAEVGKSRLLNALTKGTVPSNQEEYVSTIGTDFGHGDIRMTTGEQVKLQIWDLAGAERFRGVILSYFRGTHIVVLAFDTTNRKSFDHLKQEWITSITDYAPSEVPIILVGTKSDLTDKRQVSAEEAQTFADTHCGGAYLEVSTTTPAHVKDLVSTLSTATEAKFKLLVATGRVTGQPTPSSQDPTIQPASETHTHSSSWASGLFSSRAPAANRYVLNLYGVQPTLEQTTFTTDFKAIFTYLLDTSWFGSRSTEAAQAVLGTGTLNEQTLRDHAQRDPNSRTAQAIRILDRLGKIQPSAGNIHEFLSNFTRAYITDYRATSIFPRHAPAVDWIAQGAKTIIHIGASGVAAILMQPFDFYEKKQHLINILCHADMDPKSRTAKIVNAMLSPRSNLPQDLELSDNDSSLSSADDLSM